MKPDEWQKQEIVERIARTVEFRYLSEMPLGKILEKMGLIQLDSLVQLLEAPGEEKHE